MQGRLACPSHQRGNVRERLGLLMWVGEQVAARVELAPGSMQLIPRDQGWVIAPFLIPTPSSRVDACLHLESYLPRHEGHGLGCGPNPYECVFKAGLASLPGCREIVSGYIREKGLS